MRTQWIGVHLGRSMLFLLLLVGPLSRPAGGQGCGPTGNEPTSDPGPNCTWWYQDAIVFDRQVITSSHDTEQHSAWERLPPCACGFYGPTIPCPSCPDSALVKTLADTLQWTTTSTISDAVALSLRAKLLLDMGYSYTLTATEQLALSGTHTETTQYTLHRVPILCFTRYYRQIWTHHDRTGVTFRDWTYYWVARDQGMNECDAGTEKTTCTDVIASGTVTWNTYPNYEWAPQQPPCGGVAVTIQDPWGGTRETPCCSTVCVPPPPGENPCCGCIH